MTRKDDDAQNQNVKIIMMLLIGWMIVDRVVEHY